MIRQSISHYRFQETLGKGGMGEVYLAEDTKLKRKVAIKLLAQKYATEESARRRFLREAQTAATLDHPNICAIYEVGEKDGQSFIVMQFIEGRTLADIIRESPLPLGEALNVALQIADALTEAHAHDIVHRDIKPQNIMCTSQGRVKVLDFGLAKVAPLGAQEASYETQSLLSEPGLLVGTVPYMSPEQLRSESLDGRSDIFSLGALLYEMVSGRQPFVRESPGATISAILLDEPPPLARSLPGAGPELDRIIKKCLVKDREARYQSSQELLSDLVALERRVSSGLILPQTAPAPLPASARQEGQGRGKFFSLFLLIALAVGATIFYLALRDQRAAREQSATPATQTVAGKFPGESAGANSNLSLNSVAAMPFEIVGDNPDAEFLSRGLTEGLINSLSRLSGIKVIALNSVIHYKGQEVDPQEVGRKLDVEALVTGQFIQRGDSLTISVEIVDTRNNSHLWGRSYTQKFSNILTIQEQIFHDVTETLRHTLTTEEKRKLADQHTENREAYKLYLMGRSAWSKRTPEDLKKSISLFEQSIDLDPTYALAYAGLSDSYSSLGVGLQVMPPREVMPKAKAAALKALEFDPTLAEAHTSLALVKMLYDWDLAGARDEFEQALELNPNSATTHNWYAFCLIAMDQLDASNQESRKAEEFDPLSQFFSVNIARTFYYARQYDRTIEHCRKAIEFNPKFYVAHYLLGFAYAKKGMSQEAIAEFQIVKTLGGNNPFLISALGYGYALAGKRDEAMGLLDQLKREAKHKYISPTNMALIYEGLGEREQTLDWLEHAHAERVGLLIYLKVEPAYEDLKGDPRFERLLQKIGPAS
jgi:TolB-like protein/tRNA A-37 threonylcarbamoyl transferase component Bud32/Flp pilus assembly protein TadD